MKTKTIIENGLEYQVETYPNGLKIYFYNDILHREKGPAIVNFHGENQWLQNGKPHRLNGPAIVGSDGYREYWIEGEEYSQKEYKKKIKELHSVTSTKEKRKMKSTKRSRSESALRAVRTKQARDEFFTRNETAYRVAEYTARGMETYQVADALDMSEGSVRAYKALVSRGAYLPYVGPGGSGLCNFAALRR